MKKSLKGKHFAHMEEVKQKMAEVQNQQVQKQFWAVEKNLDRCIALNGECSESDWSFKHVRINTHF